MVGIDKSGSYDTIVALEIDLDSRDTVLASKLYHTDSPNLKEDKIWNNSFFIRKNQDIQERCF